MNPRSRIDRFFFRGRGWRGKVGQDKMDDVENEDPTGLRLNNGSSPPVVLSFASSSLGNPVSRIGSRAGRIEYGGGSGEGYEEGGLILLLMRGL
jgi:hypothetical protein